MKRLKKVTAWILSVVMCTGLLGSTGEVFAWQSYSGAAAGIGKTTPLHEDMSQYAYANQFNTIFKTTPYDGKSTPLNGEFVTPLDGISSDNLLYVSTNEAYQSNYYFLRMGAYWNDVAADNIAQFGENYLEANNLYYSDAQSSRVYSSAMDVGAHLKYNLEQAGYGGNWPWSPRMLVRFSMNARGNMLHGMLTKNPYGDTYLSQGQNKEFTMQWLETAYKYVNGEYTKEQCGDLWAFIDAYGQLNKNAEWNNNFCTYGGMTEKQMRIRTLGMICHTVEDSCNPVHTVRTYQGVSMSDPDAYGKILAFANYEAQDSGVHGTYDAVTESDKTRRGNLEKKVATLDGAKSTDMFEEITGFNTLGLGLAYNAANFMVSSVAEGKKWDEIKDYVGNNILNTSLLNEDGTANSYDGGFYSAKLSAFKNTSKDVKDNLVKDFHKNDSDVRVYRNWKLLIDYQNETKEFYSKKITSRTYLKGDELEKGYAYTSDIVNNISDLFAHAAPAEIETVLKRSPQDRANLRTLIVNANGLAQEFYYRVNGEWNTDLMNKKNTLIGILDKQENTDVVGIIESVSSDGMIINVDGDCTRMEIDSANTNITPAGTKLEKGQTVSVNYVVVDGSLNPGAYVRYHANSVQVDTSKPLYNSILGTVVNLSVDGRVGLVTEDGQAFELKNENYSTMLTEGEKIDAIYSVSSNDLVLDHFYVIDENPDYKDELFTVSADVLNIYGEQMSVQITGVSGKTISADNILESGMMEDPNQMIAYGHADVVGNVRVGDTVDMVIKKTATDFYTAEKIVNNAHEHECVYFNREDGSHFKECIYGDFGTVEECTNKDGECIYCHALDLPRGIQLIDQDGETEYYNYSAMGLQRALDNAGDGDTVKLVGATASDSLEVEVPVTYASDAKEEATLDLNGKELIYTGSENAIKVGKADIENSLVITNSGVTGGVIANDAKNAIVNNGAGTVKLTSVSVISDGYAVTGGKVELSGETNVTGGGIDVSNTEITIGGALNGDSIQFAFPTGIKVPFVFANTNGYVLQKKDIESFGYGTKNRLSVEDLNLMMWICNGNKSVELISRGSENITFEIKPIADQVYTGAKVKPVLDVTYNGAVVKENVDYKVVYTNNTNANDAFNKDTAPTATVKGMGSFNGTVSRNFVIRARSLSDNAVLVNNKIVLQKTSTEPKLAVEAALNGRKLVAGTDYEMSGLPDKYYETTGIYTLTITGKGNFTGTRNITVLVQSDKPGTISIKKAKVSGLKKNVPYTGEEISQNLVLTYKDATLREGIEYDLAYINNIEAGTATIYIQGMGEYKGALKKTFQIVKAAKNESDITVAFPYGSTVSYTKSGAKPAVTVTVSMNGKNVELTESVDYSVKYTNNKKVAEASANKAPTVVITLKGSFKGTKKAPFTIKKASLADGKVFMYAKDVAYKNKAGNYKTSVKLLDQGSVALSAGKDYSKSFVYTDVSGNVLSSTAKVEKGSVVTVSVSGNGAYGAAGSVIKATYRVGDNSFAKANVKIAKKSYTGNPVTLSANDIQLKVGAETVKMVSENSTEDGYHIVGYEKNTNVGNGKVILRGNGKYFGIKAAGFKIVKRNLTITEMLRLLLGL